MGFSPEMKGPGMAAQEALGRLGAQAFGGGLGSAEYISQFLFPAFSIPQYGGPYGEAASPLQQQAFADMLSQVQGLGGQQEAISRAMQPMQRIARGDIGYIPPEVAAAAGNVPTGTGQLGGYRELMEAAQGGFAPLEQFFNVANVMGEMGAPTGALAGLAQLLGPTGGEQMLGQFAQGFMPRGTETLQQIAAGQGIGGLQGIEDLLGAEEAVSRRRIGEEAANIREQFARLGTRTSTGAARAVGEFTSRAAEQELANRLRTRAGLTEALAGRQLGAAGTLGEQALAGMGQQIGAAAQMGGLEAQERARATGAAGELGRLGLGTAELGIRERERAGAAAAEAGRQRQAAATQAGQLGLGVGQQQLGLAGTLGQLFQGEQGRMLQAALQMPQTQMQLAGLPFGLLGQAAQTGEMQRQIGDVEAQRRMAEFQRTQGALFAPMINAILGQPVSVSPGLGTQILGGVTSLGSALGPAAMLK